MKSNFIKKLKSKFNIESYGRITDIEKYIEDNYYKNNLHLSQFISLEKYLNPHIAGKKNEGDCTLVAISTTIELFFKLYNFSIDLNYDEIYERIVEIAKKKKAYPIPFRGGTFPLLADNIINSFFKSLDFYKFKSKNIYIFSNSFSKSNFRNKLNIVLKNLINLKPSIINISFGDYKNHSVTLLGYRLYLDNSNKEYYFLEIFDGWSNTVKFIDLNKFNVVYSFTIIQ